MKQASLRSRIILSHVLIVTVTAGLFAFGVLLLKQKLEEVIFGQMVQEQLMAIIDEISGDTFHEMHLFEDWTLYRDSDTPPPARIALLGEGSHHHIIVDGHYYQVEVAAGDHGERYYLAYDITEWEDLEHALLGWLAAGIGVLALVTLVMGLGAARSILAPVTAFTRRIQHISPDERHVQVAEDFTVDEIGQIARAFDEYLARMDRFVERERSFTAAASHELRNPLSVMLGAIDVLEANTGDEKSLRATARLRRAIGDMQAFIEAALLMAREESTTISNERGTSNVQQILTDLLEDLDNSLRAGNLAVETQFRETIELSQPASLVKITLGNLLRNAIQHSTGGTIRLTLENRTFSIEDEGDGIAPEHLDRIFERSFSTRQDGTGMGLDLVKRICDRYGWTIGVSSEPGKGTRVSISFDSQTA